MSVVAKNISFPVKFSPASR